MPDRRSDSLEVEFPPKISAPRPKVGQALDYDIELECRVEAYPSPAVMWFKNGVQISNDGDYGWVAFFHFWKEQHFQMDFFYFSDSITNVATINDVTTSVLHISTIEPEHFGDYECKADNKLGSAKTRINLFGK